MQIKYAKIMAASFLLFIFVVSFSIDKTACLSWLAKIESFNGIYAMLILGAVYIVINLLILPFGLPINLLAGMLWGTWVGGILINLLATLVAALSFFIGRWFGHGFLEGLYKKYTTLDKIKELITSHDWQFISLIRINPIIPFGLSNYLFGTIPELSFKRYIIVTTTANLLPCFAFASIGSILKTFSFSNGSIILQIGVAITLVSFLYVLKIGMPRLMFKNNLSNN